jgi:hypothetical protein
MVKTSKQQEISPFLITTFAGVTVAAWIVSLLPILVTVIRQLDTNSNLSAYYITFLYNIFLPVLVFFVALAFRRRKAGLPLVIESIYVTLIVWTAVTMFSGIVQFILNQVPVVFSGELDWWYLQIVVCGASLAAAAAVMWYAHKIGKW